MHLSLRLSFCGLLLCAAIGTGCRQTVDIPSASRSVSAEVLPDQARLLEHLRVLGDGPLTHLSREYLVAQLGQARLQTFQDRPFRLTFRGDTLLIGVLAGRDAFRQHEAVVVSVVFTPENRAQVAAWLEVARMLESAGRMMRVPERSVIFVMRSEEVVDDPSTWIPARLWPPEQVVATLGLLPWTAVPPADELSAQTSAWFAQVLAASRVE